MAQSESYEGKTQRRVKWRWFLPLLVSLSIIAGWLVFAVLHTDNRPAPPQVEYSPPNPPLPLTAAYEEAVKDQVAQKLHLTVAQVAAQMQSNPDGLFGVAEAQGMSEDQLTTMLTNAFQAASDQMVRDSQWTQQQADAEMQYWRQRSPKALVGDVGSWFQTPGAVRESGALLFSSFMAY